MDLVDTNAELLTEEPFTSSLPSENHGKTMGKWWFNGMLMDSSGIYWKYHLVNVYITMENHYVQWENALFRLGHFP